MWGIPNSLRHLALGNLFGQIPTALSFEQSITHRLVTDSLESFVDYSSRECESQVYLDGNPIGRTVEDLPLCPICTTLDFVRVLESRNAPH